MEVFDRGEGHGREGVGGDAAGGGEKPGRAVAQAAID
jgi:hypothetical protein